VSILKSLLGKKEEPIHSYADFWVWFQKNEKKFFDVVKNNNRIGKDFLDKLSPKLNELKDGFFFLTGMCDDHTAELVLTADGNVRNIVFVEELVQAAPKMNGWKITALKPALDIKDVNINMDGQEFSGEKLSFYYSEEFAYPDEIDITVVHADFTERNKTVITNGTFIFLDNYLGELDFITTVDKIQIMGKEEAKKELIPISKLKAFLAWRQKEFIEKYEGTRHETENDSYAAFEAELENGSPLIAVINTDLLKWDAKASHPWIAQVNIKFGGEKNNGLPDDKTFKLLDEIEATITNHLKDSNGYLNVGRQTAENVREIYFACKEFRVPSKFFHEMSLTIPATLEFSYDVYIDKYWKSFERFSST
jgi:Family of unknown function (DUF695)